MFMGEYSHGIDEKGRLIMPAKYREALHGEFVVTKGMDGCLFVYPLEEWSMIEANFRNVSLTSKDARKFARFFFLLKNGINCKNYSTIYVLSTFLVLLKSSLTLIK